MWVAAEEGVTGPLLTALHGLQEEGVRAGTEAQVGRQRRVEVGRELSEYGNEVPFTGELSELVAPRGQRWNG